MTTTAKVWVGLALLGSVCLPAKAETPFTVTCEAPDSFSPSKGETLRVEMKATIPAWQGTLTVRDAQGRLVNVIGCYTRGPGYVDKPAEWDGRNQQGQPLPPGRYTLRLEGNARTPVHTWGEKKDNILSYYYRYGRFDGKDESFYFLSEVSFNETPFALDRGVPDRVMRRFDFDGNPLGEMIYMEGSSSAMSMSFCVDIHNSIYISGYRPHFDKFPGSFCRYDGETGRLLWQTSTAVPDNTDVSAWPEIAGMSNLFYTGAGSLRRGDETFTAFGGAPDRMREMLLDGSATMWDTDERVLIGGTLYGTGAEWTPAYELDAKTGAFIRRLVIDRSKVLDPATVEVSEVKNRAISGWKGGRETFIRVTPTGHILGLLIHYSYAPAVKWERKGKAVWVLTPFEDLDQDGWQLTPPLAGKGNRGESVILGTSHDLCPMATDIEGNSYYLTSGQFCLDPKAFKPTKGIGSASVSGVVKYGPNGDLRHVSNVGLNAGDIDVSADGKKVLAMDGKRMRAHVYLFAHAETTVTLEPDQAKPVTPREAISEHEPAFSQHPRTAADYYNKGLLHGARNQYPQAHEAFARALSLSKDADLSSCILCYDGRAYEQENKYPEAVASYRKWAGIKKSEFGMALFKAAECCREMKDAEGAEKILSEIVEKGESRFEKSKGRLELARLHAASARDTQALDMYGKLGNDYPHMKGVALLEASRIATNQKDWATAERMLKELIQYYPLYSEKAAQMLEDACREQNKPMDVPAVAMDATPGKRGDLVADVVIGQEDFTGGWYPWGWELDGKAVAWGKFPQTTAWPGSVFTDGTYLYAIAMGFCRIGMYKADHLKNFMPPDMAIGGWLQRKDDQNARYNWAGGMHGRAGITSVYLPPDKRKPDYGLNPSSMAVGGGKLYAADHFGCRVLVYDPVPTVEAAAATTVLGKADFTTPTTGNYGGLNATSMSIVVGVQTDGRRLFVADTGNHRVLMWTSLPTTNGQPADVVLGQKDFTHHERNAGGISAASLNRPSWICTHQGRLVVADTCNHRVLIWNRIPEKNFAPADLVMGQEGFDVPGAWSMFDAGVVSPSSMAFPNQVSSDGTSLYLADSWNNRVMIWDAPITRNNQPADRFIGQPDMRGCVIVKPEVWTLGNPRDMGALAFDVKTPDGKVASYYGPTRGLETAATLNFPIGVCADDKNIYVSDYERHRVLVYWK